MPSVDDSYDRLVERLPGRLRAFARRAPRRLGVASWDAFIALPPNRDIISYAAEGTSLSGPVLETYRVAHHTGGFFGVLNDRVSDAQAAPDRRWPALRRELLRAWIGTLGEAAGDRRRARAAVSAMLRDWRRGRALERTATARGQLAGCYGALLRLKLGWISATARCMLEAAGQPERALLLRRAYHLFLSALQCCDDVVDEAEDRRLHGRDVASALGLAPGALLRACASLLPLAAATARVGDFHRLATWITTFAPSLDVFLVGGTPARDQLAGMALAAEIAHESD